jgi:putative component of membrane protein insertase Oxa1/YidC/SpoIIIJ protein YidD
VQQALVTPAGAVHNVGGRRAVLSSTGRLSPASRFALRFIETYQASVSGRLGARCPQQPSCSEYGRQAYLQHGFLTATRRTAARLRRCRPGTTPGGQST